MRMQLIRVFLIILSAVPFLSVAQNDNLKKASRDTAKIILKDIEVDFITSYYEQDGNHSPVTGGIGTEYLTNFAPTISIKVPLDSFRTLNVDGGVDFYSSASSDNISNPYLDPDQVSGASAKDERSYLNVNYSKKKNKIEKGISGGVSFEWDVFSYSLGGSISKTSKDNNRSIDLKTKYYFDDWKLIYPVELRAGTMEYLSTDKRHTLNSSVVVSANINKKVSAALITDLVFQRGILSTPFHRVYFTNNVNAVVEQLPGARIKFPMGVRFNYHVTDFLILKSFYRYYYDSWGLNGSTFEITAPIKVSQTLRLSPFYRYYIQNETKYFAPYQTHQGTEEFYTSDFDLSSFTSHKYGLGLSYSPLYGFARFKYGKSKLIVIKTLNLRYAQYVRSDGLAANVVTFGFQTNFTR